MSRRHRGKFFEFTVQNRYQYCGISFEHNENGAEYLFTFKNGNYLQILTIKCCHRSVIGWCLVVILLLITLYHSLRIIEWDCLAVSTRGPSAIVNNKFIMRP